MDFSDKDLDLVIEAIDKISAHKNRPNLPRIARYLYRIHDFNTEKSIKLLELLLSLNRVKEVIYKGNISYRNALKWKRSVGMECYKISANQLLVYQAIKEIAATSPGLTETGVSYGQLELHLQMKTKGQYSSEQIKNIIDNEIEQETVIKNRDGCYVLAPSNDVASTSRDVSSEGSEGECSKDSEMKNSDASLQEEEEQLIVMRPSSEPEKTKSKPDSISVRKGDRIIKKKTKYDPSEYILAPTRKSKKDAKNKKEAIKIPKKRGRPMKSSKVLAKKQLKEKDAALLGKAGEREVKIGIIKDVSSRIPVVNLEKDRLPSGEKGLILPTTCFLCKKDLEDVAPALPCESCFRQAHRKCIEKEAIYITPLKWFCLKCRKRYHPALCTRCNKEPSQSLGGLLMCNACLQLYHLTCHNPPLSSPPCEADQPWHCYKCPHHIDMDNIKVTLIGGSKDLKSNVGTSRFKFDQYKVIDDSGEENDEKPEEKLIVAPPEEKKVHEESEEKPLIAADNPDKGLRHRPEETIPEVSDWSITQVGDYFKEKLGTDTGGVFLTQEVDGAALLSMSRQHVISGLGLKLGPALRLLYYIRKIQRNTNLFSKLWQ